MLVGIGCSQLVSSLIMIVSIWFSDGCFLPIKLVGSLMIIIPFISFLIFLLGINRTITYLFVTTGILAYLLGYIYLFIALLVNQIYTPQCINTIAKKGLWISIGLTVLSFLIPLSWMLYDDILRRRNQKRNRERLERYKKCILDLYNDNTDVSRQFDSLGLWRNKYIDYIRNESLTKEEIEKILERFGTVRSPQQLVDNEEVNCASCGERLLLGREYIEIPGCMHTVCRKCMDIWVSKRLSPALCDVCGNSIRMAFINSIYGKDYIEALFLLNRQR